MDPLTHLLAPLDPAVFFRDTWERERYVLRRGLPAYYENLVTLDDVERVIHFSDAVSTLRDDISLVRQTGEQPESRPTRLAAITSLRDVHDGYSNGFSVVVNSLERRWGPVAELVRGLEHAFQCRVTANLYLTPRGAQGFPRHYDTHDVFVLQLAGSKVWRLSGRGVELPMPRAKDERKASPEPDSGGGEDCELGPGDLLYLPRGYMHEARTVAGSSLHLTVGVHVTRWADLLADAVRQVAERDVRLREAVPAEWLRGEGPPDAVRERLGRLFADVASAVSAEETLSQRARRFLAERRPSAAGHFRALDRLPDLSLTSRLRRRSQYACSVAVLQGVATLRFDGNGIDAPERVAPQLSFVAAHETFTPADLPGPLDEAGRLVLIRRLVREGLITIEPDEP